MTRRMEAPPWHLFKWRHVMRWLIPAIVVGSVLFTPLWGVLYSLLLGLTGMSVAQASNSRWCEPGDWVLQTLQPLVSDERMVEHWRTHKDEFVLAAEMAVRGHDVDERGRTRDALAHHRRIGILSVGRGPAWSVDPYSVEAARRQDECLRTATGDVTQRQAHVAACMRGARKLQLLEPAFGKTRESFFCTTRRNSVKQYVYFPGALPRVEDGVLLGPLLTDGNPAWQWKVVPRADRIDREVCVVRPLDDRWFISLC